MNNPNTNITTHHTHSINIQLMQLSMPARVQVAASVTETRKNLHVVSSFPACASAGG